MNNRRKLLFVVNVDWSFLSHRLPIALAAIKAGYEVHIATGLTDKRFVLESHGLTVHPLSLVRGGVGVINAIQTIFDLLRIVRNVRPTVVHLVTIKPVLLGGLISRLMRVPALVSAVSGLGYVFMTGGFKARLRRALVGFAYAFALNHKNQVVIFQNPDDRNSLITETGLGIDKTALIQGSGVDLSKYEVKPYPRGIPVVVFPARLLTHKGIFEFVSAARVLKAKGIKARFALVGRIDDANPTSLNQKQLDEWTLEGVIENWGYRLDMPLVLSCASLVVLPSYREGLPKALQEAAACGRAVVTTDAPGCRDAIKVGVTGLLVPVRNTDLLAKAIEQLLTDHGLRAAMGLAGRRLAEQVFDDKFIVDQHLALYERLLA